MDNTTHTTAFVYDEDNRVTSTTVDGRTVTVTYDDFGRVSTRVTRNGDTTVKTETYEYTQPQNYSYEDLSTDAATAQVAQYTVQVNGVAYTFAYTYDANGNITSIDANGELYTYRYDSQNQMIREDNERKLYTKVWDYDAAGNILSCTQYAYTTGDLGTAKKTTGYGYSNGDWRDLLTTYNGNSLEYDQIGNLVSDGTRTYTWEHGRQLKTMTIDGVTWTYTYNNAGLRTGRTNGTDTYEYVYNGDLLTRMVLNGENIDITYTGTTPLTLTYQGQTYYYVTNIQGDVVGLTDANGTPLISYYYEVYGTGTYYRHNIEKADLLVRINPLCYRGYVYDRGTGGLMYLQSRYYDPAIGRFLNADGLGFLGVDGRATGYNLFVYCGNNPVMGYDPTGHLDWGTALDIVATTVATISGAIGALAVTTVGGSVITGVTAGVSIFGTVNNFVNGIYYNHISDGKSDLEKSNLNLDVDYFELNSDYVKRYISRWERLDYTKYSTQEKIYNLNAWLFHSEYAMHMHLWNIVKPFTNKSIRIAERIARSAKHAHVVPGEVDTDWRTLLLTSIAGFLGI